MSEQIKFAQEEIAEIREIQNNYQTLGLELVQLKLSITNVENQLESLKLEEKALTERVVDLNIQEKQIARQLEDKYGKGEIDLDSGVFTPVS
jgi:chromosome segregation ATPase